MINHTQNCEFFYGLEEEKKVVEIKPNLVPKMVQSIQLKGIAVGHR
ncbi:unnamed protein product, partial [marine sediment metagenome]